nr:D-glycero-beta-D-manno-heptose 1-phosphate adenylyltransferase [Salinibacterium sp. ZJ454]
MLAQDSALTPAVPHTIAGLAPVVTVIGDLMLDGWWTGKTERMSREAPAPVVEIEHRAFAPGGAANTAMNLAALGATVRIVGVVGRDEAGQRLLELLRVAGIDASAVLQLDAICTTTKIRIIAGGQVLVRVDDQFSGEYPEAAIAELAGRVLAATSDADAEVVCDYGSGSLTGPVLDALAARTAAPGLTVIDAHDPRPWSRLSPQLVTPNAAEASTVLGVPLGAGPDRAAAVAQHRAELLQVTGARVAVVTLDQDGTVAVDSDGSTHRTWARRSAEKQASGAGDTFVAALTLGHVCGLSIPTAADLAQVAADVVVHRFGTSVCSTADLVRRLDQFADLAIDEDELVRRLEEDRAAGRRIVLTNGCFDVLHRGHTSYLNQARQLGDVLVVAVNGDDSVRRLKGPSRPINPASDRISVLAALSSVDYVTVFDTDTPIPLIRRIRPDVYAKGGDYTPEMLAETEAVRAVGGEVRILDYVPSQSTTAVVNRILATPASAEEAS